MIKKPRVVSSWTEVMTEIPARFSTFSFQEYLKNKIFTDASKFYASDFNAKTSCYILHQKGRSSSICKT